MYFLFDDRFRSRLAVVVEHGRSPVRDVGVLAFRRAQAMGGVRLTFPE